MAMENTYPEKDNDSDEGPGAQVLWEAAARAGFL